MKEYGQGKSRAARGVLEENALLSFFCLLLQALKIF
jgi:hypothetical protein